MHNFNSDGYILIDLKEANASSTTQHIAGLYNRVVDEVIKNNKLAIVVNFGDLTPMSAVIKQRSNYYEITTSLYIFKINSNDILIIEEAGAVTVDVSIIPTLTEGVKLADFTIGQTDGAIYAPEVQTEINDNTVSEHTTWSSDKINTSLSGKANSSDLSAVATSGSYNDLSNLPTIPSRTSQLTNDSGYITSAQVPTIDDNTIALDSVWSSNKVSSELADKADSSDVYTKTEVDSALTGKANTSDVYNKSEVDTSLSTKQNSTDNSLTTTNKTVVGAINELKSGLTTTDEKIDYLRSKFYLGNYTSFTITLPDIRQGGDNFNHMTMVIGNNAFAILCCSYSQNTVSVVSLGSNTITATKTANSFNVTVNCSDTSWGGIRLITLD